MYQLAPDEERRDCGLNVLDTYFNNGVRFLLIYGRFRAMFSPPFCCFGFFAVKAMYIAGLVLYLRNDTVA